MIQLNKSNRNEIAVIKIGCFDIYNSIDDRIYLKNLFQKIYTIDDELFFFFSREESLTKYSELNSLYDAIFQYIKENGEIKYLRYINKKKFDAIARIKLDFNFTNIFIDMFKYFYSIDFFKPINKLTFEEYEDYLDLYGVEDIDGIAIINNKLSDLICIKGLGADHLIVSYNQMNTQINNIFL